MRIDINRYINGETKIQNFEVKNKNLLKALIEIKETKDNTLAYRCGCKSGICGSCSVKVNGVEKLACKTNINENDLIEPINNRSIIKDLVVNFDNKDKLLESVLLEVKTDLNKDIDSLDIKEIDLQSNCILCSSCHSSCPVYEVNKEFLGPYALTKALRYIKDKKNSTSNEILNKIQKNGIWDCTLCSACTLVCPQGIDPKSDIMNLQNLSVQNGLENPNLSSFNMDFGSDDFGGFNPNGF